MNHNAIDFSAALDDILIHKYDHLVGEISLLEYQLGERRAELEKIKKLLGHVVLKAESKPLANALPRPAPKKKEARYKSNPSPKVEREATVPQGIVKPLIEEYFKKHRGRRATSTTIYDYITSKQDTSKDSRWAWVTAISLALGGFAKGKEPKAIKYDVEGSNSKEYEWIG